MPADDERTAREPMPGGDAAHPALPSLDAGDWVAVVDDDASVRDALARLLRAVGVPVRAFATGSDFLVANRGDPALTAFVEVHLAEAPGLAVQAHVRASGAATHVVLMTGADRPTPEELAAAGSGRWLRKPFGQRELLAELRHALAHRRRAPRRG